MRFAVRVHNGFSYDYDSEIEAESIAAARREWKRLEGFGTEHESHKARNFRVSPIKQTDAAGQPAEA